MVGKTNGEQWGRLGSLDLFPLRRPVLKSAEDLGGIKEEEELPGRSEGEAERDLGLVDRPGEPKLAKQGKTSCRTAIDLVRRKNGERCQSG